MKGTLEKRGDKWRMRVVVGYNELGNPIRRSRIANSTSKREAQKELALFIAEIELGEYIEPSRMTFKEFVNEWEQKYAKQHLKETSLHIYKHTIKTHFLPAFGNKQLRDIKTIHMVTFIQQSLDKGLKSSTVHKQHALLKSIFQKAREWDFIKKSPMDGATKPKVLKTEIQPFNREEIIQILNLLEQETPEYKLLFQLALITGMRRGELLGLEWKHIDFDKSVIYVKQALSCVRRNYIVGTPKTKSSIRSIPIPTLFIEKLRQFKLYCREKRMSIANKWVDGKHDFVFTHSGHAMSPERVSTKWKEFLEEHQFRHINLHGLRHTSATFLLSEGENMKVISQRLGHSNIGTTMNIYAHVLEETEKRASSHFDKLLAPVVNEYNKK